MGNIYSVAEWRAETSDLCNLDDTHTLYPLFNSELNIPNVLILADTSGQIVNIKTLTIENQNGEKRKIGDFSSKHLFDDLIAADDDSDDDNEDKKMHAEMDGLNMNVIIMLVRIPDYET